MSDCERYDIPRFARGEASDSEGDALRRHVRDCPSCRVRLASAETAVRSDLTVRAAQEGLLPRDAESLKRTVFASIARDRAAGSIGGGRRLLPGRLVPMAAAAAAVALVMLGLQLLGGGTWKGGVHGDSPRILVDPDGEDTLLAGSQSGIPPGEIYLVPHGSSVTVELDGRGSIEALGPALFAMGSPEGGPVVYLARGVLRVTPHPGADLPVNAGGQGLHPRGSADIEVSDVAPLEARRWVIARSRSAVVGKNAAWADDELAGSVHVAAVDGSVDLSDGLFLAAGREVSWRPTGGWGAPVHMEPGRYLAERTLTAVEAAAIPGLLSYDRNPLVSLRHALLTPAPADQTWLRGLAAWLLGEWGNPEAIGDLLSAFDPLAGNPAVVRSAAVRSLALLGVSSAVRAAVDDDDPAVAEAAVLWLPAATPGSANETLERLARDHRRAPYLRALAVLTSSQPLELPTQVLVDLLLMSDPDAGELLARAARNGLPSGTVDRIAALTESGRPDVRAAAFGVLRRARSRSTSAVNAAVAASNSPDLDLSLAALRYLAATDLEQVIAPALLAFRSGSGERRNVGLECLSWPPSKKSREALTPDDHGVLALIAADPAEASPVRLNALILLPNHHPLRDRLLADSGDASFQEDILRQSLKLGVAIDVGHLRRLAEASQPGGVRGAALRLLVSTEPRDALERIRTGLGSNDLDAETALGAMDEASSHAPSAEDRDLAIEILVGMIRSRADARIRAAAVGEVTQYVRPYSQSSDLAARAILDALRDESSPLVICAAIRGLQAVSDPEAIREAFRSVMVSPTPEVLHCLANTARVLISEGSYPPDLDLRLPPGSAGDFLLATHASRQDRGPTEIARALRSDDPRAVAVVLLDAGPHSFAGLSGELARATRSAEPALRILALLRLAENGDENPTAGGLLNDPHPLVRLTARLLGASSRELVSLDEARDACALSDAIGDGLSLDPSAVESAWRRATSPAGRMELLRAGLLAAVRGPVDSLLSSTDELRDQQARERLARAGRLKSRRGRQAAGVLAGEVRGDLLEAATDLAWAAERADVFRLIDIAASGEPRVTVAARTSLAMLTGRSPEGVMRDGDTFPAWWARRSFAMRIPFHASVN